MDYDYLVYIYFDIIIVLDVGLYDKGAKKAQLILLIFNYGKKCDISKDIIIYEFYFRFCTAHFDPN